MRGIGLAVAATALCLACSGGSGGVSATASGGGSGGGADGGSVAGPGSALVTVAIKGQGTGHIRSSQGPLDCTGTCSLTLPIGTAVALSHVADSGSFFVDWGSGCSGPGTCSFTLQGDVTVWANFDKIAAPPPPQCMGIVRTAPPPVSHEIAMSGDFQCAAGMGDATGTLGFPATGDRPGETVCGTCRSVRRLFIVDELVGREKTFLGFLGSPGDHEALLPQPEGFIVVSFVPTGPYYLSATHYDQSGRAVSESNPMLGAPAVKEVPSGGVLYAGDFALDQDFSKPPRHQVCFLNADLSVHWCQDLASGGRVVGLGTDSAGTSIVITDQGSGNITAQWFAAADGKPLTKGAFIITGGFKPGADTRFETAPLIGGGVAVRRVDQRDEDGHLYRTSQWVAIVPSTSAAAEPAPHWLASRPDTNLAIIRGGTGYAMLTLGVPAGPCKQMIDILAPDGTQCGSFDLGSESGQCPTEDVALSLDGTPIQLRNPLPGTCAYRWWPFALR